ncbi:dTDP-4-dehydrorhamnose 3,5-epimerase [Humitalea rosea]|uniref:dTDP-4-dehydrorhamnose 3,5-epimerase n=1 Tax=Humitalea rosea TaxID=990373 RepID=A0A2W7I234_9PROT|nr:dTDP-4-dehydrorhamnose 3,5-epimerase [Humitalea rosea]PZW40804.1 dTDP-4-dehydrorhamnose 3,5-epimerase [Humitalea rosea]
MRFESTEIDGLFGLRLDWHGDARGAFARLFCRETFAAQGLAGDFVQASLSVSTTAGTLRGMHFQRAPHAEAKLVRCVRGAIHDVIADLRPDSPTKGRWQAFELRQDGDLALYIPKGCAHGFQTLVDDCEVLYQMDTAYAPGFADGLRHDDPALGITWPRPVTVISDKDRSWPPFRPPGAVG